MERLPRIIRNGSRFILLSTVAVSPWLVGSVPARFQLWLTLGVTVSFALWMLAYCIQSLYGSRVNVSDDNHVSFSLPFLSLALLGLLGSLQILLPVPPVTVSSEWAQELTRTGESNAPLAAASSDDVSAFLPNHNRVASVSPSLTQFQLARLVIVLTALFLGSQLFRSPLELKLLFSTLALTGATLAIFGIGQKIAGETLLGGMIPLRNGGEPFASFVNRNNAAGFLNICQAASIGGLIASTTTNSYRPSRSGVVIFLCLSAFIFAGTLASFSRGGIAAAIIGFAAVSPWLFQHFGVRAFGGGILFGILVSVLASSLHFLNPVASRIATLTDLRDAITGRWEHWQSTTAAILDNPYLGSGLGTYRYANLPYQQHESTVWFWNADNIYFELAVEAGIPGLLLAILFIAAFANLLVKLNRDQHEAGTQPVLVAGIFLLISLTLQQATDFGITLLALAIPCGILVGTCSGMGSDLGQDAIAKEKQQHQSFISCILLVALSAATTWAAVEMKRVEPIFSLCDQIPVRLNKPDIFTSNELEKLLTDASHLIADAPAHDQLHIANSQLHVYRIRQQEFERLTQSGLMKSRIQAWDRSSLEQISNRLQLQSRLYSAEENVADPRLIEAFQEAHLSLVAAFDLAPWTPDLGLNAALTLPMSYSNDSNRSANQTSMSSYLRREALLASGNASRLLTVGRIALQYELDKLGISCLRRSLSISPVTYDDVIQIAQTWFEDDQICARLLFTFEHLIDFAKQTQSLSALNVARERLTEMLHSSSLSQSTESTGDKEWIASQISMLSGNTEVAIQHLKSAIISNPFCINWRLDLAEICMSQGDNVTAREQLAFVSRLVPESKKTQARIKILSQRLKDGMAVNIHDAVREER
ncbi:O-antigen ligase family protein [Planctomicrobium sp. SH527]|uniref:O-antigen ligase family protein n=1 Tax=Planctomicrobium sp. SH527 TaxID=3448123 RepID=UPI003F5B31DF